MDAKAVIKDGTYIELHCAEYRHSWGGVEARNRNVLRTIKKLLSDKDKSDRQVIWFRFYDKVSVEMPFEYKETKLILRDSNAGNYSLKYFPGSGVKVLTRRQVYKIIPALGKRMRECGYHFGIRISWREIMVCKKYRAGKGYIAADAEWLAYPPYPLP